MTSPSNPQFPSPDAVDPLRLTLLLEEAGWRLVGGRTGVYNRFIAPGEEDYRFNIVVPLDKEAPEFGETMAATIRELANSASREPFLRTVVPRLSMQATDEFRFRKESVAPSGLIKWKQGEDLISSARGALLAGAKSFMEYSRHFNNRFGQFASRYLDTVLMGQTAPGSYVVTALTPTSARVALRGGQAPTLSLEGVDVARSRDVTISVVQAVQATIEALDHYRNTKSLSGFDDRVDKGVSYEMTVALRDIASNADESDIHVEWDPIEPVANGLALDNEYRLISSDAGILDTVSKRFVTSEPSPKRTIVGRVHLLTKKQADGPGVVGIEALDGSSPRKVRARLNSAEDYHRAVLAHDEDLVVEVGGSIVREGTLHWMYNATLSEVRGPIEELFNVAPSPTGMQTDIFDELAEHNANPQ